MNRMLKTSPTTYKMETTGPKVPSRYLSGPTGSRHDHCKCESIQTTETKPMNTFPKRVPKPPVDKTQLDAPKPIPRIKKQPSIIPKVTTPSVKNNNIVKDQILKKDDAVEPKRRDLKLKAKPVNPPPLTTPRRRHSDMFLPNKDMTLPSARFPNRRLSEINIHPNKDVATVSNVSLVRSSRINKNESTKDSKIPLVKRSNSLKTTVSSPKINAKVPTLRTYKSLPKPEVKSSRKSKPTKPVEEVVPEKTLPAVEPNNAVEITVSESQSQNSPESCLSFEDKVNIDDQNDLKDAQQNDTKEVTSSEITVTHSQNAPDSCSSSEEKVDTDDQSELKVSPLSMEDDKPSKDGQQKDNVEDSEVNDTKDVTRVETTISQSENSPNSCSSFEEKVDIDDQNELKVSSPIMEDDNPAKDSEVNYTKEESSEDTNLETNELKVSSPSMEDANPTSDGQQNDNGADSEVNDTNLETLGPKLVVETEDGSPNELRFRRGTVISPQSENTSPRKLDFNKGKELDENETGNGELTSLRRLSSDGVVSSPEKISINVDLKHQEMEEKKPAELINNVLEETASKLIRSRKSKVQALVGAFENVVSSSNPPQASSSTKRM